MSKNISVSSRVKSSVGQHHSGNAKEHGEEHVRVCEWRREGEGGSRGEIGGKFSLGEQFPL